MSKTRKCIVIKRSTDSRTAIAVDVEYAEKIFGIPYKGQKTRKKNLPLLPIPFLQTRLQRNYLGKRK